VFGLIVVGAGAPIVARFVRDADRRDAHASGGVPWRLVRDALRSRVYWTLLFVVFGTTLALNGVVVHLSALLIDRGLPASHAVMVMSVMGGGSLAGRLVTGWLLDRFDAIRVLFVLLAVAAAGVYLLADANSFVSGVIAAACIGFGTGGEVDVVPYLLSRYFGLHRLGTLLGVVWMAFGLAGAAGPVMMGRAFDSTGSYQGVLIALAAGAIAAAGLILTLPAYQSHRVDVATIA
jgi:MFS family permease